LPKQSFKSYHFGIPAALLVVAEGKGMFDEEEVERAPVTPFEDFSMLNDHGERLLLTHLSIEDWREVYAFYNGVIPRDVYIAIIRLRVLMYRWRDAAWRDTQAKRSKLINLRYFDESFNASSPGARLTAAVRWAIGTYASKDPDAFDARLTHVSLILSAPVEGRTFT
jgi:hypothetical protein